MGKYLVVSVKDSKVVDSFENFSDAFCLLGEKEHDLCTEYPTMSYEEAHRIVAPMYKIYEAIY